MSDSKSPFTLREIVDALSAMPPNEIHVTFPLLMKPCEKCNPNGTLTRSDREFCDCGGVGFLSTPFGDAVAEYFWKFIRPEIRLQ